MELTYHTDFALRVLMYAGANPGRRVTLGEIAKAYGISKDHLRKVVHRLGQAGYLTTVKGRSGGLTLSRDPATIRVGEVVQAMEGSLAIIDCRRQPCPLAGGCALKRLLDRARQAFLDALNTTSLAELLEEPRTRAGVRRLAQAL